MSMTSKASVPGCRERRGGLSPNMGSSLRGLFIAALLGFFATSALAQTVPPALTGPETPLEFDELNPPDLVDIPRLKTASVNLTWNRGNLTNDNQAGFRIFVGSRFGFGDIANVEVAAVKDKANYNLVVNIPADDRRVYVRLHWTVKENIGGVVTETQKWIDYIYLSANVHYISSPTPGTTIGLQDVDGCKAAPSILVEWVAAQNLGQPDRWWLYVGTAADPDSILNSGEIAAGERSFTVNNIPTNGQPIIITLWWEKGDANDWQSNVFGYNTSILPSIKVSNPLPGTEGAMELEPNGLRVQFWWVYAGTAADVPNAGDPPNPTRYHSAGLEVPEADRGTTSSLVSFQNFPDDGSNVEVVLWWRLEGEGPDKWKCRQFTYKASSGPVITAPVKGGDNPDKLPIDLTSPTNTTTVTWDDKGTAAQQWQVVINEDGDPANNGLWKSALLAPDVRTVEAPNTIFTTDGRKVYIILRYWVSGGLAEDAFTDAVVCVFDTKKVPYLTAPGSIAKCFTNNLGNEVTFEWLDGNFVGGDPAQSPLGYWLYVGSTQGGREFHNSGALANTVLARTVTNLPTDGAALWVRLWWLIEEKTTQTNPNPDGGGGIIEVTTQKWLPRDFKFTNPQCPEITDPTYGGTIIGAQRVITIDRRNVALDALWVTVSSIAPTGGDDKNKNPQTADIDDSNLLTPTTTAYTVRNLPIDGSQVYVTLWWLKSSNQVQNWNFRTFCYVSSADAPLPSLVVPDPTKDVDATDLEFAWKSNNAVAFGWWLYVADNQAADKGGGADGFNVHNSGFIQPGENDPNFLIKEQVNGLPCGTFFVTLWYLDQNLTWLKIQYTLNNKAGCGGGGTPPGDGPSGE